VNPAEIFEKVKAKFPQAGKSWASGYAHGVSDGLDPGTPNGELLGAVDSYGWGYTMGYYDAVGEDLKDTLKALGIGGLTLNFRWWDHD